MKLAPIISLAAFVTAGNGAQDYTYVRESKGVYDEARVMPPTDFTTLRLRAQFESFVSRQCTNQKLARLVVAPTQQELAKIVNKIWFADGVTSTGIARMMVPNLTRDTQDLRAAQALCIDGNSTALVRQENRVERLQLSGSHDTRRWNIYSFDCTIVGFQIRGDSVDGWVSLFVRTNVLPNDQVATSIRDELQRHIGVRMDMILRTDPFFWDVDGPRFDAFDIPTPSVSVEEFMSRKFVSCPPSDDRRPRPCHTEVSH